MRRCCALLLLAPLLLVPLLPGAPATAGADRAGRVSFADLHVEWRGPTDPRESTITGRLRHADGRKRVWLERRTRSGWVAEGWTDTDRRGRFVIDEVWVGHELSSFRLQSDDGARFVYSRVLDPLRSRPGLLRPGGGPVALPATGGDLGSRLAIRVPQARAVTIDSTGDWLEVRDAHGRTRWRADGASGVVRLRHGGRYELVVGHADAAAVSMRRTPSARAVADGAAVAVPGRADEPRRLVVTGPERAFFDIDLPASCSWAVAPASIDGPAPYLGGDGREVAEVRCDEAGPVTATVRTALRRRVPAGATAAELDLDGGGRPVVLRLPDLGTDTVVAVDSATRVRQRLMGGPWRGESWFVGSYAEDRLLVQEGSGAVLVLVLPEPGEAETAAVTLSPWDVSRS